MSILRLLVWRWPALPLFLTLAWVLALFVAGLSLIASPHSLSRLDPEVVACVSEGRRGPACYDAHGARPRDAADQTAAMHVLRVSGTAICGLWIGVLTSMFVHSLKE